MIEDIVKRLTAREFLAGVALFVLVVLNFERGYDLSEELIGMIIAGLAGAAAFRLVTKNGEK